MVASTQKILQDLGLAPKTHKKTSPKSKKVRAAHKKSAKKAHVKTAAGRRRLV